MAWNRDTGSRPMPINPMSSDPFLPERGRGPETTGKYQPPMTARGRPESDFDLQRNHGHVGYPDPNFHESPRSSNELPPRPVPAPVEYPSQKNNTRNFNPSGRNDLANYYDRGGPRNVPMEDPQGTPRNPPPPPNISTKSHASIFQDYFGLPNSSQNSSTSTTTSSNSNPISKPNQYFLENQYRSLSAERRGHSLSLPSPVPAPKAIQHRPSPDKDLSILINKTQKSVDNPDGTRRKIQSMEPPPSSTWSANPAFLDSNYMDDVYKGKEMDKLGFSVRSTPELMTSVNPATSNQDHSRSSSSAARDHRDEFTNQKGIFRRPSKDLLPRDIEKEIQKDRSLHMLSEFKALYEKGKSLEEKERVVVQGSTSQDFQILENNPVLNTLSQVPNPGVILDQLNQAIVQALHEQIGGAGALLREDAPGPPIVEKPFGGNNKTGKNLFHENFRRRENDFTKNDHKYIHEEPKFGGNRMTTGKKVIGICSRFRDFGNCKFGKECRFSHDLDKVDICTWFRDYGKCKYGEECAFSHKIDRKNDQDSVKEINNTDKTTVIAKKNDEKAKKSIDKSISTVPVPSDNDSDTKASTSQNNGDNEVKILDDSIDDWRNSPKIVDLRQKIIQKENEKKQQQQKQKPNESPLPNKPLNSEIPSQPTVKKQITDNEKQLKDLPNKPSESAVIAKPNHPAQKLAVKKPVFDYEKRNKYEEIKKLDLRCHMCDFKAGNATDFRTHLKSDDHGTMILKFEDMHEKSADIQRSYIRVKEYQKVVNKGGLKFSVICNMCQVSVYGDINKHRSSNELHARLRNFLHPLCDVCDQKFVKRIDWDKHKITADHMYKVEQEAAENNVIPKQGLEYYEPFEVRNAFKTKIPKDERKVEETKNMEMEDDPYEIDRIQESAKLTLKKIGTYEIPTFDETKMIGISFVKPQTISLCKACKTRVTDDIETHCKEKAHYDNFVNIVNGKKTKAIEKEQEKAKKAGQDDAGTEALGSNKRKLNPDEDSDSDDDDGNWKRKRRDYMETSDP